MGKRLSKEQDVKETSVLQLTASQEKCRRVWTSFGIGRVVLDHLWPVEAFNLQALNRFWYNSAVSRVQTRILLNEDPLFFTFSCSALFESTLFCSNKGLTGVTAWRHEKFNFSSCHTVQVGKDLLVYDMKLTQFLYRLSGLTQRCVQEEELAAPITVRFSLSLVNFNNTHLVAIGGYDRERAKLSSVDAYDIERDEWTYFSELNRARSCHSSCVIGGTWIYTFCGDEKFETNSNMLIEYINAGRYLASSDTSSVGAEPGEDCKKPRWQIASLKITQ